MVRSYLPKASLARGTIDARLQRLNHINIRSCAARGKMHSTCWAAIILESVLSIASNCKFFFMSMQSANTIALQLILVLHFHKQIRDHCAIMHITVTFCLLCACGTPTHVQRIREDLFRVPKRALVHCHQQYQVSPLTRRWLMFIEGKSTKL